VGSSQADKAASHDRIVTAAAARIRRDGIDGVSVNELMSEAGLTHGGFYRHFASRDDLVAEAVEHALAQGSRPADAAARTGGTRALAAVIDGYLSETHRDHPESGCAVAALPGDVARSTPRARQAYSRQVRRYIDLLVNLIPATDPADGRREAVLTLAALVGAVSMARAVDDPALSGELLAQTAAALRMRGPGGPQ
jgi:TetR/AcrR family transcriptional repressor of nem operon